LDAISINQERFRQGRKPKGDWGDGPPKVWGGVDGACIRLPIFLEAAFVGKNIFDAKMGKNMFFARKGLCTISNKVKIRKKSGKREEKFEKPGR